MNIHAMQADKILESRLIAYGKQFEPLTAAREGNRVGALFTTPQEVHDAKVTLDAQIDATNHQWQLSALGNPQNNPTFSQAAANDFAGWDAFVQSWNAFAIEDSSLVTASSDMDRVHDFASQLAGWQSRLTQDTHGSFKPVNQAAAPSDSGGQLAGAANTVSKSEAGALDSLAKPLIQIAVIALGGYLAVEFLPVVIPAIKRAF